MQRLHEESFTLLRHTGFITRRPRVVECEVPVRRGVVNRCWWPHGGMILEVGGTEGIGVLVLRGPPRRGQMFFRDRAASATPAGVPPAARGACMTMSMFFFPLPILMILLDHTTGTADSTSVVRAAVFTSLGKNCV